MNLFAALLLGHLIGDFPLQTNRIAQSKHENRMMLVSHVLIHICVTAALLNNPFDNLLLLCMIGCSHYFIDSSRVGVIFNGGARGFLFDQTSHLASLSLIASIVVYTPHRLPMNALPTTVLYPALAYGLLLGSMVFGWIWANETTTTATSHVRPVYWMRSRMLLLSQRAGVLLLSLIIVALFTK
ncbi:MAG: DUF3307 domain-containing protein [Caldilineaceae bacterium]